MTDNAPRSRPWFQFRLRTLMIVVTLLAIVCGAATWVIRANQRLAETAKDTVETIDGYVPDADTAIKIAVAVWEPIYGKDLIAGEKPYQAHIANGVWTVEGSLPKGWLGGVAVAEIAKDDGKVLRVGHGK